MSTSASEAEQPPQVSGVSEDDELSIRSIAPTEQQNDIMTLLQGVMSEADHWSGLKFWQWKHVDNPFGESLVLISEAQDGRIAGLRAFMRWRFRSPTGLLDAFRPVDTATHPDFRRRGIFTRLTKEALEHSRQQDGSIIFNTPNSMSVSGYLKMGWTQVGVATPALKVRNYPKTTISLANHLIRKRLKLSPPAERSASPMPDDLLASNAITPDFKQLIEEHHQHEQNLLATDMSVPYLTWRYADNPLYQYAVVADRQSGALRDACVVRMVPSATLSTLIFEQFLVAELDEKRIKRLVGMAFDAFSPDVGSAYAPSGSDMRRLLSKSGFRWNSRSRINFVSNPLRPGVSPDPAEMTNWSIGMSELEIF